MGDTWGMGEQLRVYGETVPVGRLSVRAVADDERERAIGWLRHHCGLGTLTLDEFGDRAGEVYKATTEVELWRALEGLDVPHKASPAVPEPVVTPEGARRAGRRWHIAIFSGANRRGRWRIASQSLALALFGGVDLDLRSVSLEDPDTKEITITAVAMFGGIGIVVPDGMEVDMTGLALFGGKECRPSTASRNPSLPLLQVRALVLFGGLDVRSRRPASERKRAAAELRRG
jgi:hypothetical protein